MHAHLYFSRFSLRSGFKMRKKNVKINMVWVIIDISLCLLCNGLVCANCKASFKDWSGNVIFGGFV